MKRHEANDRLAPPLIKPDGRFSRIRLSEGHSRALLLRPRLRPRGPRGQPIQAMTFPQNFPWIRFPQGLLASALAPEPALQPHGRILVQPVKAPRAVGVVEIPAPAFEQSVHFRDHFVRGSPLRPVVEFLPQFVPQLGLAFGVGFDMRIVSSALATPPTHAKPKEFES